MTVYIYVPELVIIRCHAINILSPCRAKKIPTCVLSAVVRMSVASNLQHKDKAQCDKSPNLMAMSALSTIVVNHNNPWKPWTEFTEKDNHKSELSLVNYKRVNRSNGTKSDITPSILCRLWSAARFGDFLRISVLWYDSRWTFGGTGSCSSD